MRIKEINGELWLVRNKRRGIFKVKETESEDSMYSCSGCYFFKTKKYYCSRTNPGAFCSTIEEGFRNVIYKKAYED